MYHEMDMFVLPNRSEKEALLFWLGMKNTSRSITWSNGSPINESEFLIPDPQQTCVAIEHGEWQYFNCSERTDFLCENGKSQKTLLHFAFRLFQQANLAG